MSESSRTPEADGTSVAEHNVIERIASLVYHIRADDPYRYAHGISLTGKLGDFEFTLQDQEATFKPTSYFKSSESARAVLHPLLAAWEVHAMLHRGVGVLNFEFRGAHIERTTATGGALAGLATIAITPLDFQMFQVVGKHVAPPSDLGINECVDTLAALFARASRSQELLLFHAYAMSSCVSWFYKTQALAAAALNIDIDVLKRINKMSSTLGVGIEARKHEKDSEKRPLNNVEREWLMKALRELVLRAGAVAANVSPAVRLTL